jgi:hypothetical protein
MTRHLKLAAAVLAVLLTISGFAPAGKSRSHSSSKHGHGGGGCSSSHSTSHNSRHYDDDDDDDYGTSGSSGSSGSTSSSKRSKKPRTKVISCASASKPRSLVEVDSRLGHTEEYAVSVTFLNKAGETVDTGTGHVEVPPYDEATVSVKMPNPSKADQVTSCRVLNVHATY